MDIQQYINELDENGYTIIPNVIDINEISEYIDEFNEWMDSIENLDYLHSIIHYNGIFKYFQVGHQRFAWLMRTNKNIQNIFKKLWNTDELVVSFDGCCYYPNKYTCDDRYWIHSDQSPIKKGKHCVQSFISMTNNKEKTFIVYEGSHKLHEHYSTYYNLNNASDWLPIKKEYINSIKHKKKILNVKAGSMVLWDSRTFHQNSCGPPESTEDRLVQYLCFLPKNSIYNDKVEQEIRHNYFENYITTNHFPYPIAKISEQPLHYNSYNPDYPIYIDYSKLKKPFLYDLLPEIYKLL